jgi:hypothetical protein
VPDVIHPVIVGGEGREIDFEEERGEEIGFAGDQTTDALAEVEGSVEFDWDGFGREGDVSTIDVLEEGELGVARQIGVLTSPSHELEKSG